MWVVRTYRQHQHLYRMHGVEENEIEKWGGLQRIANVILRVLWGGLSWVLMQHLRVYIACEVALAHW